LPRSEGHRRGINNVRKIIKYCRDMGIKVVTFYCFSTENWDRSAEEVSFLMTHLEKFLDKEVTKLDKEGIKVKIIGERYMLPKSLQEKIKKAEEKTKKNRDFVVNFAISYGSRQEIVQAIKGIVKDCIKGKISPEDIDMDLVGQHLYTYDIPDPDLLIRTSGEKRISNFLLWQLSYAELYFTPTYWPDFDRECLYRAVVEYSRRERRFGKVVSK